VGPKVQPYQLLDGRTVLAVREGTEVRPIYSLEAVASTEVVETVPGVIEQRAVPTPKLPSLTKPDLLAQVWLEPGSYAIFGIEKAHVPEHTALYLRVRFEWEGTVERGLQHRVYFHSRQLRESKP
jgi:hypothetical protein